jgi:cytochrome c-type biogenesis protein CcmH
MAAIVVVALAVGSRPSDDATEEDRVRAIASTVKCPQCSGQSAASSDSAAAAAIRAEIARRVRQGDSPDEIRTYLAGRFDDILLTPPRSGAGGIVWGLPVAAVVVAFAGLALVFHRWQASSPTTASAADRELVARARAGGPPVDSHGEGDGR